MKTLETLVSQLKSFNDWVGQGGEKRAGLPEGSSREFAKQCRNTLPLLEKVHADLKALQVLWEQVASAIDTNPSNHSGTVLLNTLRNTDETVDAVIGPANTLHAQLVIFDTSVRRKKEQSDEELAKIAHWQVDIQARVNAFKAQMDTAASKNDRNLAHQAWMQWMQTKSEADWAKANETKINKELVVCIDLLQDLWEMDGVLTSFRNQISSIDGDLEQAVKQQHRVLITKSERLGSYYRRQVGTEIASLLAFL